MGRTFKQELGTRGEDEACSFLKRAGFAVVDRNYWRPWGEIDVVVRRGKELRFVEVKTVSREHLRAGDYEPEDNMHPWKRQRLHRIIETYLLSHDWCDELDWQVDVISIYINKEGTVLKVEHLEDVAI